jgi:hypothetical protein
MTNTINYLDEFKDKARVDTRIDNFQSVLSGIQTSMDQNNLKMESLMSNVESLRIEILDRVVPLIKLLEIVPRDVLHSSLEALKVQSQLQQEQLLHQQQQQLLQQQHQ